MKKTTFYFAFLFFTILFLGNTLYAQGMLNATDQAKQDQQKAIEKATGRWWNGMEMGGITLEIAETGTYTITEDMQGEVTEKGKWTITKNVITLISTTNNKTLFTYVTNANIPDRNKVALKGKGCTSYKGFCYFKAE